MIADLDAHPDASLATYDLCVVGTGPAGMTVVNELRAAGLRIAVLESGQERPTALGDRLRVVQSDGIHIKDYSRERVLGGASTTWAGLSSPLDPIDCEPRDFLRGSAWPLERSELLTLYAAAAQRYRFPELSHFEPEGFGALRPKGDLQPAWEGIEEKVFLAAAEPQNFGQEWRDVFDVQGIDLWLDATVLRFEAAAGTSTVASASLRTRSGRELPLHAKAFVLATGGIENARLLLNSRDLCADGLGNEHDQVGRYLMNHPKNYHGSVVLARPVESLPYYFGCLHRGFAGYAGLRLKTEQQVAGELMNSYIRLEPIFPWTDSQGVEALVLFVKRSTAFMRFFRRRHSDEVVDLRDYSETGDDSERQNARQGLWSYLGLIWSILIDLPRVTKYVYYRVSKARLTIKRARIRNFMEMEPDPDNRVTLGDERDPYDQPKTRVTHRPSARDRRSMVALHEALAREFEATGFGRLENPLTDTEPWPIDQDASHHIGTTRMGLDPTASVVDVDLKLHAVDNLYLAGSSVFPSSGCANPTFTIVALSIRLAAHLRRNVFDIPA